MVTSGSNENLTYTAVEFDFSTAITQDYTLYATYSGEAIMMARKDDTVFWQEEYRTNITKIIFEKGELSVPSTAIESWDVKENDNCLEIIAYIENDGIDDGYQLTITSTQIIYSNISMASWFDNFSNLKSIEFSNLDTSRTQSMTNLFHDCNNLTELDLSTFNTEKVSSMHGMFWNCNNITNLNVSSFDTSNVSNMRYMFYNCSNLTELNIVNFDTSNVTTMRQMFTFCESLTSLDLSSFNTINVTDTAAMFQSCFNLTNILVSQSWTMEHVVDTQNMFLKCGTQTVNRK